MVRRSSAAVAKSPPRSLCIRTKAHRFHLSPENRKTQNIKIRSSSRLRNTLDFQIVLPVCCSLSLSLRRGPGPVAWVEFQRSTNRKATGLVWLPAIRESRACSPKQREIFPIMNPKSAVIDRWRQFFHGADGDIFNVLEYAILVAASDYPKEFKVRRDGIAQKLFACRLIRCIECDSVAMAEPVGEADGHGLSEACRPKGSKVNSTCDDNERINRISNYSYDEAEALTEEIEEESQIVGEVFRIKAVLNNPDKSEASLFESLRRLQFMELSVDTLKTTEIGKAVSALKKHVSKEIRNLAKTLICFWKEMVDEWVRTMSTVTGDSPDSVNPSTVEDEEGLPSPPLDEGAFLATPHTSIELSQFFDGMDDDGNLRTVCDRDKVKEYGRTDGRNVTKKTNVSEVNGVRKNAQRDSMVFKEVPFQEKGQTKVVKPRSSAVSPRNPPRPSVDYKLIPKPKTQHKQGSVHTSTSVALSDKSKSADDDILVTMKLEAAKRKLHERYQEAENAKKQRTIQVMELQDLPKQGLVQRHSNFKPGFHNRQWNNSNGRR